MTDTTKKCSKCGEVKLFSEFYSLTKSRDGLGYSCKRCVDSINTKSKNIRPRKAVTRDYEETMKDVEYYSFMNEMYL